MEPTNQLAFQRTNVPTFRAKRRFVRPRRFGKLFQRNEPGKIDTTDGTVWTSSAIAVFRQRFLTTPNALRSPTTSFFRKSVDVGGHSKKKVRDIPLLVVVVGTTKTIKLCYS